MNKKGREGAEEVFQLVVQSRRSESRYGKYRRRVSSESVIYIAVEVLLG